jgi:hypothetical protein
MRVLDLQGNPTSWSISANKFPRRSLLASKSKLQYSVGVVLDELFPFDVVLEEVTLPNSRLAFDFFLPKRLIAVEVDGQQHFSQVPFFHKTNKQFHAQQDRDRQKEYFCELNGIELIRVCSPDELRELLQ